MTIDKCLVAPLACLITADEPAPVRGVRLDDPELWMMFLDVVVGIHAPHLVRSADEIDAELRKDCGRVMQCLRQIIDAAPYQEAKWPPIIATRYTHNPI